jgi:Spy/CpxP family protein refolding chaperone
MQTPWKVIVAFLGVFVAGSIFGGFFALRVDRERKPQKRVEQPVGTLNLRLMRRFAEQLDLTEQQKEMLRPVMERAGEDLRRVQQAQLRETSVMVERLQQDVAKVLTPEQKLKLETMQRETRERMKAGRGNTGAESRRGEFAPPHSGNREAGARDALRGREATSDQPVTPPPAQP